MESDLDLRLLRERCHNLCTEYNSLKENDPRRREILKVLFSDSEDLYLQGPIYFDYGINTHFGKGVYANFNFTCVDVCPVIIGEGTFFGPNVAIYTPLHPLLSEERNAYFRDRNKENEWTLAAGRNDGIQD